jgi:hypothetical protein
MGCTLPYESCPYPITTFSLPSIQPHSINLPTQFITMFSSSHANASSYQGGIVTSNQSELANRGQQYVGGGIRKLIAAGTLPPNRSKMGRDEIVKKTMGQYGE